MKVLLVDDHKLIRDGLRAILEREGVSVVGEAGSGREALELSRELRPDVVIMDISMPDLNGVDATKRIVGERPETKIIGLSMRSDHRYVAAMFQAGAKGYLLKNSSFEELIRAIHAVAQQLTYVSPAVAGPFVDVTLGRAAPAEAGPNKALSVREREVLQLLAEGKTSKEIATKLSLALPTVESHRRQIMEKLGLRSIAELTKYAVREGLTSLE